MIVVESAGLTDVGLKRKGNEDAFFLDDDLKLYVVADGMGGHQAGEVASGIVVKTVQDTMRQFRTQPDGPMDEAVDKSLSPEADRLAASIRKSNMAVYETAGTSRAYRGMGSTVAAVCFTEDTLIAANVGDSPVFLIRDDRLETLSVTHTVMAEQLAMNGRVDSRFNQAYGHMLTRAVGVDETVTPDICELPFFKGDILVLASDGLTNKVSEDEIRREASARKPAKACEVLVKAANERGGEDNITVIILKVNGVQRKKGGITGWISRLFRWT